MSSPGASAAGSSSAALRVDADSLPIEATVERLAVAWHPLQLVRKKLKVDRIEVSGVEVTVRKTAPKEQPKPAAADSVPATIELPIAIDFGELSIKDARLTVPDSIAVDLRALRAGGSLDAYWLEADAMVSAANFKDVAVSLAARGAADHADVRSLRVKALDGTLTVDGQAAWSPAISWDMAAAIDRAWHRESCSRTPRHGRARCLSVSDREANWLEGSRTPRSCSTHSPARCAVIRWAGGPILHSRAGASTSKPST